MGETVENRLTKRIGMENPFAFKVFQVFTGFGIGCGAGIGVGQPINLGAVPMAGQLMSAAGGATYAVSGVTRHVNDALRKVGAKNVRAGIGCGVGFGHGFGLVGFSVRPSVVQKMQATILMLTNKMVSKIGTLGKDEHPTISDGDVDMLDKTSMKSPLNGFSQMLTTTDLHDGQFGSQTEKVLQRFMQNPILNEDSKDANLMLQANQLRSQNNVLQMVLKHQVMIEQLMEENEKLRKILTENVNIPPSKVEASTSRNLSFPCSDCFECRRKQRRR